MSLRIRFEVTPREQSLDSVDRALAGALAHGGEAGDGRGEREIAESDAVVAARVCEAVNAAFAGASVRFECDAPAAETTVAAREEQLAVAAGAVRDVNGAGARAALPKLLAFLAVAKREEARRAEGEEIAIAKAWGDERAAVESLRGLACAGARPVALAVKAELPNPCSGAALERMGNLLCAAAVAAREFGVRVQSIGFAETVPRGSEVTAAGVVKPGAARVSSFARGAGERLVFLGETATETRGSRFLEAVHGLPAGAALAVDVAAEKRLHDVLRTLAAARAITAARGVGEGGLITAVCGMLLGGERAWGAKLDLTPLGGTRADALLFGERSARAVVEIAAERVGTVISEAHMHGVPAALIGEVTAEDVLDLKTRSLATAWPIAELRAAWAAGV